MAMQHKINGMTVLAICQIAMPSSLSMKGLIVKSMRLRGLEDRLEVAALVKRVSSDGLLVLR